MGFDTKIDFKDYNSSNESIGIERDELYSEINNTMIELLKVENPFHLESKSKSAKLHNDDETNENKNSKHHNEDTEPDDEEDLDFDELEFDETADTVSLNSQKAKTNGTVSPSEEDPNDSLPIITNTTLNIIRLFGKYIHMLSIFKIISSEVISYLMQLFYFYMYYIYLHFAHEEVRMLYCS